MHRYILGRLLATIPTLLGVITLVFIVMRLVPGTIVDQILSNGDSSEEVQASLRAFFGLDQPVYIQYLKYLGSLLTGDMGVSWRARFPATEMIMYALPVTLELAIMAAVISMVVGVTFGALSAVKENTPLDHVVRILSLFSLSMPVFWQATMIILVLSLTIRWAPLGYISPMVDPIGNLSLMFLPALALGTSASASVMRMTRSCLLDVMRQDYIRTAQAKGLRERTVVVRHAIKNAMIPVVTILGLQFGSLLGGSVVVESVFGIPGIGLLILNAIGMRDYPIVQGAVIFTAVLFMAVNLLVDVLYGYLDPAHPPESGGRRRTLVTVQTIGPAVAAPAPARAVRRRQWYRPLVRNPLVLGGLLLVIGILLVAVFAGVIAPRDPIVMNAGQAVEGPSLAAPFGTDRFGRDVLSRVIYGARASLTVGIGSIVLAALVGTLVGLIAGYSGGMVDNVLGRLMDIFFTFPSLILAIAISAALGLGIQNALFAIAVTYWPAFGRVVRGATLAEASKDYVEAARVVGASDVRVVWSHVLPNVLSPLIVQFTVAISQAIIIESSLSYLGLGTQPPTPSWGTMINEGRTFLDTAPWISVFPGLSIMAAVLAFNLLGDGLRDILDPRSRPV